MGRSAFGYFEGSIGISIRGQDYCALVHYLDQAWWLFLLDGRGRNNKSLALEELCKLCCALGCKNPTEKTFAAILVLVHGLDPEKIWSEPEKYQILQANKPAMKKMFTAAAVHSGVFLEKLPETVSECPPAILAVAYPKGFVSFAPSQVDLVQLQLQTETFPLRKTNRAAPATAPSSSQGVSKGPPDSFWQGLFSWVDGARSSGSLDDSQSSDLPGFRILQKSKRAKTSVEGQTALPLEDQGNREEETETKTQVCGTAANVPQLTEPAKKKAEDLIASMQAGLEAEKKQLRRSIARGERNKQSLAKNRQARLWRLSNVLRQKLQWPIRHQAKWQKDLDTKSILPAKFSRNGLWIPWQSFVSNSSKKFQRNCRTSTDRAAQPAAIALSVLFLVGRKEAISHARVKQ